MCVFGWPKVHLRVAPQKEWNEDNAVVGLARVLLLYYCITVLVYYNYIDVSPPKGVERG